MKYFIKPITQNMICDLKRARETELSKPPGNICCFYNFYGTLSALDEREYVEIKTIYLNGREILSVYVTQAGINFLERYEKNKKNIRTLHEENIT
jgi:hypothetical protein